MDMYLLQTANEFVAISLSVAVTYLLVVWLSLRAGELLGKLSRRGRPAVRPGEHVHQALKLCGRLWDHYRSAMLIFLVSLGMLANFGRAGLWAPLPDALNGLIAAVLAIVLVFMTLKVAALLRYRRGLRNVLHLHDDVAEKLVEAQLRGNRVFHSVQLGDAVLDNVVVGSNGIYTIQLFLPPAGTESVALRNKALVFEPKGTSLPIHAYNQSVRNLRDALSRHTQSNLNILPVIVIPELKLSSGDSDVPMLVSIQTCTSFVGWAEKSAYLLDEEVASIVECLTNMSGLRQQRASKFLASLDARLELPGLTGL